MDYELRFQSLLDDGDVLCFPCDREGLADMNAMDRPTLNNYLYARALVGIQYSMVRVDRRVTMCACPDQE